MTTLTQQVYAQLRADILACRLKPGARLRMNSLCKQHDVSLGAVREALARLHADGFVTAEPQQGFRVAAISAAELADLTRVRTDIERMCLERSIELGDLQWEASLVAAFHQMSRTPQREPSDPSRLSDSFAEAHRAFHDALVAACDSPWLLKIRDLLYAQTERYRRLSLPLARIERDVNSEHRAIMDAALARDAERALELLTEHLKVTTRVLLETPEIAGGDGTTATPPRKRAAKRKPRAAAKAKRPAVKRTAAAKGKKAAK